MGVWLSNVWNLKGVRVIITKLVFGVQMLFDFTTGIETYVQSFSHSPLVTWLLPFQFQKLKSLVFGCICVFLSGLRYSDPHCTRLKGVKTLKADLTRCYFITNILLHLNRLLKKLVILNYHQFYSGKRNYYFLAKEAKSIWCH